MEKNCKWHFDEAGRAVTGPNDSIYETFKANPYYSIVREAIQNSLDVQLNKAKPVKVVFSFDKIEKVNYPNLFEIKKHIIACWQTHKDDIQAEKLFSPMSGYIDRYSQIEILKISDFNTIGMDYNATDYNSPFMSFLGEGKSAKKEAGSGGSFGFGKGAYYVLSKIRTLIVSTKTESNKFFFEGRTRLATHKIDDKTFTRDGFYNKENSTVDNIDEIPDYFKRDEPGTDIYVIGLIKLEDREQQMIKSVLNNFWLAIHDNKLIVQIGDVEINRSNLEQIIDKYFEGQSESGTPTDIESWNPKSYLKSVKYAKNNEQFKVYEERLPTIGEVKLFVYLEKGLPNRVSYFRSPKMVVFKKTNQKVKGYSAVFICDNERGNKILRLMENPAHNEWKPENYLDENDEQHSEAKKAKKEISDFINSKLDELSKVAAGKKLAFQGLEEYLSIPEDLLEKEEEFDFEGDLTNTVSGEMGDEVTDEETPVETTEVEKVTIKPTISTKPEVKESDNVEQDEDGSERISSGGENEEGGGDQPGEGNSGEPKGERNEDSPTKSKVLIKFGLKVAAQRQNGHLFHHLIINTKEVVPNAELELLVGSDNDREDSLEILETDNGNITQNTLKNVNLDYGRNLIKVRFADNLKHTVKMKAYELQ